MDDRILLKSKTNYECLPVFKTPLTGRESWRRMWVGAMPGSGGGVGREGPPVGSALGTGIQAAGCVGWVRYGAHMSPGLVGMIEGSRGVWARGQEGLAQPAAQGLCAGSRCRQWHLRGNIASVLRRPCAFGVTSTLHAGCKGGDGMKSLVLQGNRKPLSAALQPAGKPAHRFHGKDSTMRLNLKWIWSRLRMDD